MTVNDIAVNGNSLLTGVNDGLLRRLQSVQNAAARLVTGTRRCEHNHSSIAAAALVTCSAAYPVQTGESRLPCTVGLGAALPCWRLSADC